MGRETGYEEVIGTVERISFSSIFNPWVATVSYTYEGERYTRTEGIRVVSGKARFGPIALGWTRKPAIANLSVGSKVVVLVSASDPARARIRGNVIRHRNASDADCK